MSSNASSNSSSKADLSGELSSLDIGNNNESSNNEEKEAANTEIINTATICANCGKEGDGDRMNTCNKCDLVKYCNAACKKKHKSKHKKKCERRVAELHDKSLFKEPPPREEECPICMLLLPLDRGLSNYQSCCGKQICSGCIYGIVKGEIQRGKTKEEMGLCPYCRTPYARSDEEDIKRLEKLMDKGNADAYHMLAGFYDRGTMGMPQNRAKANELYLKAGELGCAPAYFNLGSSYYNGDGVEIDKERAMHYFELAAMNGDVKARHNLGYIEAQAGNFLRAYKHLILSARAGYKQSLEAVKQGFMKGLVTKEEYAQALRAYHNLR